MIAQHDRPTARERWLELEPALPTIALCDARGVPLVGRHGELDALRAAGARDASIGRIFEGHLNGAQLVARCGTDAQREALREAIGGGHIFGVWNTQDDAEPLRIERTADRLVLRGAKTWASGAGTITRPIVTAAWPDGGVQMLLLRIDEAAVAIDPSGWQPLGMHASESFRVDFDGVTVGAADCIGAPGDYQTQPWFFAGALRYVAVQTGIMERLFAETVAYLRGRARHDDAFQCARVAEMKIAVRTALAWLDAGAAAWIAFDRSGSARECADVIDVVDMARTVVERAALDVIERAVRSVGARGLVEPEPFAALVRDLQMYLRQPAPDAALVRIGRGAFGAPSSGTCDVPGMNARNVVSADSTGTSA